MEKTILVLVMAALVGCAVHMGTTTGANSATQEPAKTTGFSIAIGQAQVGPVEGGAVSVPFATGAWCTLQTVVLSYVGRAAPPCATSPLEPEPPV